MSDERVLSILASTVPTNNIQRLTDDVVKATGSYNVAFAVADYVEKKRLSDPSWTWKMTNYEYDEPVKESKTMKITVGELKRLLSEEVLHETADAPAGEHGVSLDAQIDKYFSEYENEAKSSKQEGTDFSRTLKRLLSEAGEDDGSDTPGANGKVGIDAIDVESFANSVVRLIQNYDSLLEVRSTILRRATNYLAKVYDGEVTKQFEQTMLEDHGMEAGKTSGEVEADQSVAPPAIRSGGGDEGAPGG